MGFPGRLKYLRQGSGRKRFDLVVANIDFRNLKRARITMLKHIKKRGFLILSGILDKEEERLCQQYLRSG